MLVVCGFFLTVLFAAQNIQAQPTPDLIASRTTATITIDGQDSEAAWSDAEPLIISNVDGSGVNVQLKALSDGTYLYLYAEWNDDTESNTRRAWSFNGTHWSNIGGNEDRIAIIWSVNDADVVCGHDPNTADTMLFDVWHWKASRTAPAGWADDKYWDGTGRHSDTFSAGGVSSNSVVAQASDAAAITTALGNSSPVTAFSNNDRPYWDNSGSVISWSGGVNATPIGNLINGYKTVIPTGSNGDVLAESVYEEESSTFMWHVEFKRALDTGNSADDITFEEDTLASFYVAIFDNTGDDGHFKAGGSSPTEFTLNIPSPTTTTPTTPTTPTAPAPDNLILYAGIAGLGIVIVVVIVVLLKRR